jgi:predicted PurR-regulated permease PerM
MPRILGEKLGLHPMVVFFALLAGGASMGLLGVLVAIPLTAALVILVQEFVLPALTHFADEDSEDEVSAES